MTGDDSAVAVARDHGGDGIKGITLLVPVWGYRFVGRFLEFCLPTLLSPNNIPALARELPCRFVLLTTESSVDLLRSHPVLQRLANVCTVDIQLIDDLVTDGNHTATITLAFERMMRQAGDAMRETCFIFLMSDYIVADGSLKTVLSTMRGGARGVLVGNFQVTAEEAAPLLRAGFPSNATEIALDPRRLLKWSLRHLHPATVANIVNLGLTHNAHVNRLFWRVDDETLIGRFYLMHAIAIRPEVMDFVVGSSWDYSFIPELCPSGKVATITDSDDYLVVELQPRGYESANLRPGPLEITALSESLAEWATAQHRANVGHTLIYHAGEAPPGLPSAIAQADTFVNAAQALLTIPPKPHRDHPYWVGSIAANRRDSKRLLKREDWQFILGEELKERRRSTFIDDLRATLFGFPPGVSRLHPLWRDYAPAVKALDQAMSDRGRTLLVSSEPKAFAKWVARKPGDFFTIGAGQLLELSRAAYLSLPKGFDRCLCSISETQLESSDELLARVRPLLKEGGQIHILVINPRPPEAAIGFNQAFVREAARFLQETPRSIEIVYVPSGRIRWSLRQRLRDIAIGAEKASVASLPFRAAAAIPAAAGVWLGNIAGGAKKTPPLGIWSSVFVTLRPLPGRGATLPLFREPFSVRRTIASASPAADASEPIVVGEPQHRAAALDQDDPERQALTLARYRFVASLLGSRHDVAEVGSSHPAGTELVARGAGQVTVYDSRPEAVQALRSAMRRADAFAVYAHDVLSLALPRQHDSIYSVDFMQYVSRDDEHAFIRGLRASLSQDFDVLLIGCPCRNLEESGAEVARDVGLVAPSTPPAFGTEIVYRTPHELRELIWQHFHTTFVFSMIDDIIHPGILREAAFAFVLGCGRKDRIA